MQQQEFKNNKTLAKAFSFAAKIALVRRICLNPCPDIVLPIAVTIL